MTTFALIMVILTLLLVAENIVSPPEEAPGSVRVETPLDTERERE